MSNIRIRLSQSQQGNPPYRYILFKNENKNPRYFSTNNLHRVPNDIESTPGFISMTSPKTSSTHVFENLDGGQYYAAVLDSVGNWSINPVITYDRLRLIDANKRNYNDDLNKGFIRGEVEGGAPPYNFKLTGDGYEEESGFTRDNFYTFDDLESGRYKLDIIDSNDNMVSDNFNVENEQLKLLSLSPLSIRRNIIIEGENTGEIQTRIISGLGNIRMDLISNDRIVKTSYGRAGALVTFNNLVSDSYSVTAYDEQGGTFKTAAISLDEGSERLRAILDIIPVTDPISGTGSIIIESEGGVPPYTYTLTQGTSDLDYPVTKSSNTFNNLQPGLHRGYISDSSGQRQRFEFIIDGYETPEIDLENTEISTFAPTSYNGLGRIRINNISGGYNPSFFRLRNANTGAFFNDYNTSLTQNAPTGTYDVYAKEPAPLNTEYLLGRFIIPEFSYEIVSFGSVTTGDATGEFKNDGTATININDGIGPFELEITPLSLSPDKNYNDIDVIQINERHFQLENLPTGTHRVRVLDITTQDESNSTDPDFTDVNVGDSGDSSDIEITIGFPDKPEFQMYTVGITENIKENKPGVVFANVVDVGSPFYIWNLTKVTDPNFKKIQYTPGPVFFANIPAGVYEISASTQQGETDSMTIEILSYTPDSFNIVKVDEAVAIYNGTQSVKVKVEGGVPEYHYKIKTGDFIIAQKTSTMTEVIFDNVSMGSYTMEITDTNEVTRRKKFNVKGINGEIDDPLFISSIMTMDESGYQIEDGSIEVSVGGGTYPIRAFLYDRDSKPVYAPEGSDIVIRNNTENFYWSSLKPGPYYIAMYENFDNVDFSVEAKDEIILIEARIEPFPVDDIELNTVIDGLSGKGNNDAKITIDPDGGLDNGYKVSIKNQMNDYVNGSPYNIFTYPHEITGLGPGIYTLRIEDLNDPSIYTEEIIEIKDTFGVNVSTNAGDIKVQLTPAPGGAPPFLYELFTSTDILEMSSGNTNARSYTFTMPPIGTYYVKVTDRDGLDVSSNVIELKTPLTVADVDVDIANPNANSNDGIITVSVPNIDSNFNYMIMSGPSGPMYPIIRPDGIFQNLATGFYQIMVTDTINNISVMVNAELEDASIPCEGNNSLCDYMEGSGIVSSVTINNPIVHTFTIGNKSGMVVIEKLVCEVPIRFTVNYEGSPNSLLVNSQFGDMRNFHIFHSNGNIPNIEIRVYGWDQFNNKHPNNNKEFKYKFKVHCPNSAIFNELVYFNGVESITNNTSNDKNNCNGSISFKVGAAAGSNFSVALYGSKTTGISGFSYDNEPWQIRQIDFDNEIKRLTNITMASSNEMTLTFSGLCGYRSVLNSPDQIGNTLSDNNYNGFYIVVYNGEINNTLYGCLVNGGVTGGASCPTSSTLLPLSDSTGDIFQLDGPFEIIDNSYNIVGSVFEAVSCLNCVEGVYNIYIENGYDIVSTNFPFINRPNDLEVLDANKVPLSNADYNYGATSTPPDLNIRLFNLAYGNHTFYLRIRSELVKLDFFMDIQQELEITNPVVIVTPTPSNPTSGHVRVTLKGTSTQKGNYSVGIRKTSSPSGNATNVTLGTSDITVDLTGLESGPHIVEIFSLVNTSIQAKVNMVI